MLLAFCASRRNDSRIPRGSIISVLICGDDEFNTDEKISARFSKDMCANFIFAELIDHDLEDDMISNGEIKRSYPYQETIEVVDENGDVNTVQTKVSSVVFNIDKLSDADKEDEMSDRPTYKLRKASDEMIVKVKTQEERRNDQLPKNDPRRVRP